MSRTGDFLDNLNASMPSMRARELCCFNWPKSWAEERLSI
jgi:hypothetical protein